MAKTERLRLLLRSGAAWGGRGPTRLRLWWIAVILGIGTGVSLGLFGLVHGWERGTVREELRVRGRERAELLKTKVLRSAEVLYGIRSFFTSHPNPSREEFHNFVASALERQPELRALEWVPRVKNAQERERYESLAQADGFRHFQFTQQEEGNTLTRVPVRGEYFPVFYVEPVEGNLRAAGYDLGSSPLRRPTLEEARDTGLLVATCPVVLAQETGEDPYGVLMVLPVYGAGEVPTTVEGRREMLTGFTLAVFRISDLIDQCLSPLVAAGMDVAVKDAGWTETLYRRNGSVRGVSVTWTAPLHPPVGKMVETLGLEIGGRTWNLTLRPTGAFVAAQYSWQSWGALIGGLMLTAGLGAYLLRTARHMEVVEFHVARRTTQLMDEIQERKTAEESLQRAHEELEERVALRTRELATANTTLQTEVAIRKQAEESAERANRAKSAFLATMSHEIRTPMNAILGYSQLLSRDDVLVPAQQRAVKTILTAGTHLMGVINEVLDLSKIESGRMELVMAEFDLPRLVHGVVGMFEHRAAQKNVRLFVDVPSGPYVVNGDEGKLRQVLINLVGNAVKFTDAGHVLLTVRRGRGVKVHDEGKVEFEVSDTGTGIPVEEQGVIFEPFRQTQTGSARGGTGLGLAIAREFVRLMNGESEADNLRVRSAPGEGAVFTFAVPLEVMEQGVVENIGRDSEMPVAVGGDETEATFALDEKLYERMKEAAETCSTTELKRLVGSIPRTAPEAKWLARALEERILAFDFTAVTALLKRAKQGYEEIREGVY